MFGFIFLPLLRLVFKKKRRSPKDGPSLDVVLLIHSQCDIPLRRKLEQALGCRPIGIQRVPQPKVDLLLHKQRFVVPKATSYVILEVHLKISDTRFYRSRIYERTRFTWQRYRFPWGRRRWRLDIPRWSVLVEANERWWLNDTTVINGMWNLAFGSLILFRSSMWVYQQRGKVFLREGFCLPGGLIPERLHTSWMTMYERDPDTQNIIRIEPKNVNGMLPV